MGILKVAHADLAVADVAETLVFHTELLGLTEIGNTDGTVFLGCGIDNNYDLALVPGGTGVRHFALQVDSEDDLVYYGKRLAELGVATQMRGDAAPGQGKALRFQAPDGHSMELVLSADRPIYLHPSASEQTRYRGFAPLDADHITLRSNDVRGLIDFLVTALDFKVSDVVEPAPGTWAAAWARVGEYHHDVAVIGAQDASESLDHFAWSMDSMEHVKRAADMLSRAGIPLETGPGRHGVGGNLYAYFWSPGGNRYELSAEMPRTVSPTAEPKFWNDFPKAFSAWGALPPESFQRGS